MAFFRRALSKRFTDIYIITPVIGFMLTRTQCMYILHSLGSIPARRHFYKRTLANHVPGTNLTPGWRVANVDQCLAKGH